MKSGPLGVTYYFSLKNFLRYILMSVEKGHERHQNIIKEIKDASTSFPLGILLI